jgi:hypothetical protein
VKKKKEKVKTKWKKCIVDYYCNRQWNGCGWTMNSS